MNKGNPTPDEVRLAIVKAFNEHGFTYVQIASLLGIGAATVSRILRRYRETGHVDPKPRGPGRRSEIQGEVAELLLNLVEQHPYSTIDELHAHMVELSGIQCGPQAVRLALLRFGYSRKKTVLSRQN